MRLTTIGVQFFQHDGLAVGTGWSEFDYATAGKAARVSFREHVGRFVKIHPDDVGELAPLGLVLMDGVIVDAAPLAAAIIAPATPGAQVASGKAKSKA